MELVPRSRAVARRSHPDVSAVERPVLELYLGDRIRLRKPHPCGGRTWLVTRLGADIGLACDTCGRRVLLERRELERRFTGFVERGVAPDPPAAAQSGPPAGGAPSAAG
jgi:hypothetical protein